MVEPDDGIFPLLRERRAELKRGVSDAESCFVSSEAWLEQMRHRPDFGRRVAKGEIVLAGYAERHAATRAEATGATPEDSEPRG